MREIIKRIPMFLLSTLLLNTSGQDKITFGSYRSIISDFLQPRSEGKLIIQNIPDTLVVDQSGSNIFHNLVHKTTYKKNGAQWMLDNIEDESLGLKITENDWISIKGNNLIMFPIPTPTKEYVYFPESQQYIWIASNDAVPPYEPGSYRLRAKVTKTPPSVLESARLIVRLVDTDKDEALQTIVQKCYEIIAKVGNIEYESLRVISISRENDFIEISFVYDENSEDCTVAKYIKLWSDLTGDDKFKTESSVIFTQPKKFFAESMQTDNLVVEYVKLEQSEDCAEKLLIIPAPVMPVSSSLDSVKCDITLGTLAKCSLSLVGMKIVKSVPEINSRFLNIEGQKLNILLPRENYYKGLEDKDAESYTITISDGTLSQNIKLTGKEADGQLAAVQFRILPSKYQISIVFNDSPEWNFENVKYALERLRKGGIDFELIQLSDSKLSFAIPENQQDCNVLASKNQFINSDGELNFPESSEWGGVKVENGVNCKKIESYAGKTAKLTAGDIITIPLPAGTFTFVSSEPALDPKLFTITNNEFKILLPAGNLKTIFEDSSLPASIELTFKDAREVPLSITLSLDLSAIDGQISAFTLQFIFSDKTIDHWSFQETLTAVEMIKSAKLGKEFKLMLLEGNRISYAIPENLADCSAMEQFEFIDDGELYFDPGVFENEWEISSRDSLSCKKKVKTTTSTTTLKPITSTTTTTTSTTASTASTTTSTTSTTSTTTSTTTTKAPTTEAKCMLPSPISNVKSFEVKLNSMKDFSINDFFKKAGNLAGKKDISISVVPEQTAISEWNNETNQMKIFATYEKAETIAVTKKQGGIIRSVDHTITVKAKNCKPIVIKVEIRIGDSNIDSCTQTDHSYTIDLYDSAQLEWPFAEQQLINKITKELYKDQTTEFMRVEKFERGGIDDRPTISLSWSNSSEIFCDTEDCPQEHVQKIYQMTEVMIEKTGSIASVRNNFKNIFEEEPKDYSMHAVKAGGRGACEKSDKAGIAKGAAKKDDGPKEGAVSWSVILLIAATIIMVFVAIGCIYMKKNKAHSDIEKGNLRQSKKTGAPVIMDCDGDNRENEVLLVAEQKSPLPPDFSTADTLPGPPETPQQNGGGEMSNISVRPSASITKSP